MPAMPYNSDKRAAILVAVAVTLSRIPFLSRNYGFDGDAWNVAYTARLIAEEGTYRYSRPPGYPIQEYVCSLLWKFGPLALNTLTALFSAAAAMLFFMTLRALGFPRRDGVLAAIALAFVPVIYINSTVTLDYVWALAFLVASLFATVRGRPALAGIALGAAIGCRITSGAMIVPLGILVVALTPRGLRLRRAASFAMFALAVGAISYLPVIFTYGPGFFSFTDTPLPLNLRVKLILFGLTAGTWGMVGTAGLALLVTGLLIRHRKYAPPVHQEAVPTKTVFLVSAIVVALYVTSFVRLPLEWAYLVPIVPFVLLPLYLSAPLRWSRIFSIAVIVSPFFLNSRVVGDVMTKGLLLDEISVAGPLLIDTKLKREQLESLKKVYEHVNACPGTAVILEERGTDRLRAMPPGQAGLTWEKTMTFVGALPHRERRAKASHAVTVYTLIKEEHRFVAAFVHYMDKDGNVEMRVDKF